jgi:hypothetical protein
MGLKLGTIQKCSGKILTFYDGINMGIQYIHNISPIWCFRIFYGCILISKSWDWFRTRQSPGLGMKAKLQD